MARSTSTHDDPSRPDAELLGDEGDRERGEVVVAEQENASPVERPCLVQREHAPDLRLDVAVHLIELDPRCGRAVRERGEPFCATGAREEGTTISRCAQAGQAASAAISPPGDGEQLAAVGRQLNRARPVDDAALPELVADRADDRDGQLGDAADLPDRNGLEPGSGAHDVANACIALGQADARGNLVDDPGRLRHRRPRARIETLVRVAPSRSLTT